MHVFGQQVSRDPLSSLEFDEPFKKWYGHWTSMVMVLLIPYIYSQKINERGGNRLSWQRWTIQWKCLT